MFYIFRIEHFQLFIRKATDWNSIFFFDTNIFQEIRALTEFFEKLIVHIRGIFDDMRSEEEKQIHFAELNVSLFEEPSENRNIAKEGNLLDNFLAFIFHDSAHRDRLLIFDDDG